MLVTLGAAVAAAVLAVPQNGQADPPTGLTVVMVAVGQGDGLVVQAPNGTVHVIDAGPSGQGTAAMLPTIATLAPTGYGYTFNSHFHIDHLGGLDEVLNAHPFTTALDRGDVNRPSNNDVNNYLAAAGARRQTIVVGGVYSLGGGAIVRCISANGVVTGGTTVPVVGTGQEENSRSVALRLEYGLFSMWFGGDLTGGGTTADVETAASLACGNVDVYKCNHHGSNTSTNLNLIANLQPELAVVSCGVGNSFGHPTTGTVNRINQAVASRILLSTTTGSASTIGFGVVGTLRITTDGQRYRATAQNGSFLDFYCDEVPTPSLAAGDLRISEVHRNPSIVPDTNGEYVEVVNVGAKPVGLAGLSLADGGGSVTIASNFMAVPGRPILFQVDGAGSRNGGQPLGVPLPFNSLALGDTADNVTLTDGATVVDTVTWSTGFAGGSGVAAERRDLFATTASTNWSAATMAFGSGDLGSPGRTNDVDTTAHGVQVGVSLATDRFTVHGTAFDLPGMFSVLLLAQSPTPTFPFANATIPLAFDSLLQASLSAPGFVAFVPTAGYRSVDVSLPQPNPLSGTTLHAAHVTLDFALAVPGLSPSIAFVLP
ncbi:MAG: lamin tail domain-containing protein [Planctomycetes bacterium]|nr:lamin tail domain-containing protein [Planctomycetota bacterium]